MASKLEIPSRKMEESIFELARNGDSYVAIERASLVVRNYRKHHKLDEGILFYMKLAQVFLERKEFASSCNCALKAIKLFPSQETKIKKSLKDSFTTFILNSVPEMGCSDLFEYINLVIQILGDPDDTLQLKELEISRKANFYYNSQIYLFKLIKNELNQNSVDNQKINNYLLQLGEVLSEWVLSIPNDQRIYNSQFIFARSILSLLQFNLN